VSRGLAAFAALHGLGEMNMLKECIAMLLAGGEGSRLGILTKDSAKPAVPFGGKYRIIDFTLSNCTNSGIDTVGVLTQYQPLELNDYIGSGVPWDLDRIDGGIHILPPYQRRQCSDWYKGTANAISQNISFIERYQPEYLLVLSGDHIYKMDYSKMLAFHKEKNADGTISVIDVSLSDASRFGIMNTLEDGRIREFEEKPEVPKSTKASMGVYIFNWKFLKKYLELDEKDSKSSNDFGKNIIPSMLQAGEKLYAYPFQGYWRDVGTAESLWKANMDLLFTKDNILTSDSEWKIYAKNPVMPPHYISTKSKVTNSIISEGCMIEGDVENSVIFDGVKIEENVSVHHSVIMPGTLIKKGSEINYSIIAENAVIGMNSKIGILQDGQSYEADEITVIGNKTILKDGTVIGGSSMEGTEVT
jgi:glucose-1-phosphate adenylyltransferase